MKYLVILGGLLIVFGVGLKINAARFSKIKMEQMMMGKGRYVTWGDDPCARQVTGDPTIPDQRRIRVDFVCPNKVQVNTISFSAVPDSKAITILNEVARIDWFDPIKVYARWKCTLNGQTISDNKIINYDDEIKCEKI